MADASKLPSFATWRHLEARTGFEVVFFAQRDGRVLAEGHTAALEGDEAFAVSYALELDSNWRTRVARISGRSAHGGHRTILEGDGRGAWRVDGSAAPHLDGCLDVDLESSALTNAFPVARLALGPREDADAPAAYVRALSLTVERLEQRYSRLGDQQAGQRYAYSAPAFDFHCELVYDEAGLLLEYPGIASRVHA